jgi:uncharacterized membrane protein YraQ (UPF0718 family)
VGAALAVFDGIFRAAADAASWVVIGLVLAGLIHEFVPPARLQRLLGRGGFAPLFTATGVGALLPMCSCGVVPTAIGLFRTGAGLGPSLAFMVAAPVINPAAVILCLALLGPRITIIYVAAGVVGALAIGWAGDRWLAGEARARVAAAAAAAAAAGPAITLVPDEPPVWWRRLWPALRWGVWELGTDIGYYILLGLLASGLIGALVPGDVVSFVLGRGLVVSLLAALLVGLPAYVCAVGSIPLVATLLLKGAAPGAAIVFLMSGPATNLGELFAIAGRLGKRAAALFAGGVAVVSLGAGLVANAWLGGLSYEAVTGGGGALQSAALAAGPSVARFSCPPALLPAVLLLAALGLAGVAKRVRKLFTRGVRSPAPVSPSAGA